MKNFILICTLCFSIPTFAGVGSGGGGGGGVTPVKDGKVTNDQEQQSNNTNRARNDLNQRLQDTLKKPVPTTLGKVLKAKVVDGKLVIDLKESKIQDIMLTDGTIIDVDTISNEEDSESGND